MAEEDFDLVPYKDISEIKKELEGMKGRKDISAKELYDAVQKLAQTTADFLEVFGAAAEQLKLDEKEYEAEAKKHEMMILKLDKIIEQNKTIAEGMVAIVEMVKQKLVAPAKEREELFKPKEDFFKPIAEPSQFMRPPQPEWKNPEPMMPRAQPTMMPPQMAMPPVQPVSFPEFETQMPPMQPTPMPDFGLEEEHFPLEEEPKKKGLFGMFKK